MRKQKWWQSDDGTVTVKRADWSWLDGCASQVSLILADPPYGIKEGSAFVRKGGVVVGRGSGAYNSAHGWQWLETLIGCCVPGANLAVFHKQQDALPRCVEWWHRYYLAKQAPAPNPRPTFVNAVEECSIGKVEGPRRWFGSGYEPNLWYGMTPNRRGEAWGHPTEKPLDAVRHLIRVLTKPGDLVLDPFLGSGTTAEACLREGRRFIGTEVSQGYFEIIQKRLEWAQRDANNFFSKSQITPIRQRRLSDLL